MDSLGRFYTNNAISRLLVNNLKTKDPRKILDLGIGDASLTIAAYSRWNTAQYYATEIEKTKTSEIEKHLSYIKVINCDTLQPYTSNKLRIEFGSIDIAICNPPYVKIKNKSKYNRLFNSIGCDELINLKNLTSEIVFFAHNLRFLKNDGELGIIVSDSLITGREYKLFRETIFKKFNVRRIIQLPDNIFEKTEARTHIIFLEKGKASKDKIPLFLANNSGLCTEKISVYKEELINRMDFIYHYYQIKSHKVPFKTLEELKVKINRGRLTHKQLKELGSPFIHTTNMGKNGEDLILQTKIKFNVSNRLFVKSGDILMARVGKGCVGKISRITKGQCLISDCVYLLRINKKYKNLVWNALISKQGESWLRANSHGVCAKLISKIDLLTFPVPIKK